MTLWARANAVALSGLGLSHATRGLRGPRRRLDGERSEHLFEGGSVGELLLELERAHPATSDWILDEGGVLRRQINVW